MFVIPGGGAVVVVVGVTGTLTSLYCVRPVTLVREIAVWCSTTFGVLDAKETPSVASTGFELE